jgi:hypothetical protein
MKNPAGTHAGSRRTENYRRGAAKGAEDREQGRSVGDWSKAEMDATEWGFSGWRGYWDAHDERNVDMDIEAEMSR